MDNYTHIKTLSLEDVGHYLCETMDYVVLEDKSSCDICPMWSKCKESTNNGWTNWLREAKK